MALHDKADKLNSFKDLSSKVPFWKLDLPESLMDVDGNDFEESDLLCELVRNYYLYHLHQTLLDNLNVTESVQKTHFHRVQQCVDICVAEIEKQALRQSIVASIYRQGMSKMINEVKNCTKNSEVYFFLKNVIESDNQSLLQDKYFELDIMKKESVSIGEVYTEKNMNKSVSTQTETCTNLDVNLSFNTSIDNADPVYTSNVSHSSCDMESKISESNVFNNLNSLLKSPNILNCTSVMPMEVNYEPVKCENPEENKSATNISTIESLLKDLQDSPEYEQPHSKLDERLITLESAFEEYHNSANKFSELPASTNKSSNIVCYNKINEILENKFKSDYIAKSYELRRSMNKLPPELKKKINLKFDYLFGNGHDYESNALSEKEECIVVHKRIAKMVVKCMMPYYNANRISRCLFKILAKLISDNLMDRSYAADEEIVARGIDEFFIGGKCIKTLEDIYQ